MDDKQVLRLLWEIHYTMPKETTDRHQKLLALERAIEVYEEAVRLNMPKEGSLYG